MARTLFVVPLLPKTHYYALQKMCTSLPARQGEMILAGVELLAEQFKEHPERLEKRLAAIRSRRPSEAEPLL